MITKVLLIVLIIVYNCSNSRSFSFNQKFATVYRQRSEQELSRLTVFVSKIQSFLYKNTSPVIPVLLLFLFAFSDRCEASPLNPQCIQMRGPFFQGWLLRTSDHEQNISSILIIGSFSATGSSSYDEHYIFCGISTPARAYHFDALPDPSCVMIEGSLPTYMSPFSIEKVLNVSWTAKGYGSFRFLNNDCKADFKLGDCRIRLDIEGRRAWSLLDTHRGGPEGWLTQTTLLPCHYFVHSVGSSTKYNIEIGNRSPFICFSGSGYTHIEGNHGTFFPNGWVWAQAGSKHNRNSFSIVGGKFEIGLFSPLSWIIYLREGDRQYVFRTTDLNAVKYKIDSPHGRLELNASSSAGAVELIIQSDVPFSDFGPRLYIPTSRGT